VIVMVQCVGSRDEQHPYCSRVCCAEAVKNALRLKELWPASKVIVLYREIAHLRLPQLAIRWPARQEFSSSGTPRTSRLS